MPTTSNTGVIVAGVRGRGQTAETGIRDPESEAGGHDEDTTSTETGA